MGREPEEAQFQPALVSRAALHAGAVHADRQARGLRARGRARTRTTGMRAVLGGAEQREFSQLHRRCALYHRGRAGVRRRVRGTGGLALGTEVPRGKSERDFLRLRYLTE